VYGIKIHFHELYTVLCAKRNKPLENQLFCPGGAYHMSDYKKPDYWSLKAQKEGYPARSVYKLQEMDEKFSLLPRFGGADSPFKILDLGAAPGSWSLYVLRRMAGRGFLAAADLVPLSRQYDRGLFTGKNFFFIRGILRNKKYRRPWRPGGPITW
jgi:23S rRNA (uridine2552-2'-O)-methyltransferase